MYTPPLVSIGLPTYNRAVSLARAIESALGQDYHQIELIISDNASTDDTQAVCVEACKRDSRIKYLRQPGNVGAVANFQAVLNESHGEFFMWLADDDWLERSYVAKCVEVLMANEDHVLVSGAPRYYNDEEVVVEESGTNLLDSSPSKRVLAYYNHVGGNGVFYGVMRREHLIKVPLQNTFGGDWLLIADIAFIGKIKTLASVFINRSMEGVSRDLKTLAVNAGLRGFMAQTPHLNIATNAWKNIVWKSPVYGGMNLPARFILGCRSYITICRHCLIRWWHSQAYEYVSRKHPRLRSLAKNVKNKLTESSRLG